MRRHIGYPTGTSSAMALLLSLGYTDKRYGESDTTVPRIAGRLHVSSTENSKPEKQTAGSRTRTLPGKYVTRRSGDVTMTQRGQGNRIGFRRSLANTDNTPGAAHMAYIDTLAAFSATALQLALLKLRRSFKAEALSGPDGVLSKNEYISQ